MVRSGDMGDTLRRLRTSLAFPAGPAIRCRGWEGDGMSTTGPASYGCSEQRAAGGRAVRRRARRGRRVVWISVVLLVVAMTSCSHALERQQASIRDGLITLDLHQLAFLEVWGKPFRTSTISGEEVTRGGFFAVSGSFVKGKELLEIWAYEAREIDLVFHNKRLVGWRTDRTVAELATEGGAPDD